MAISEKGLLSNCPLVPATGFGRPLWQKMQPAVIGRLKPKSVDSYPGRGPPTHGPGIERQRRLKEIPVFLDDPTKSIHSSPDDPFDLVGGPKALLPVGAGSRFALVELSLQRIDLKVPVELFVEVRGREMTCFPERPASPETSNAPCWSAKIVDRCPNGIPSKPGSRHIRLGLAA